MHADYTTPINDYNKTYRYCLPFFSPSWPSIPVSITSCSYSTYKVSCCAVSIDLEAILLSLASLDYDSAGTLDSKHRKRSLLFSSIAEILFTLNISLI